jgi:hypothetical protein
MVSDVAYFEIHRMRKYTMNETSFGLVEIDRRAPRKTLKPDHRYKLPPRSTPTLCTARTSKKFRKSQLQSFSSLKPNQIWRLGP